MIEVDRTYSIGALKVHFIANYKPELRIVDNDLHVYFKSILRFIFLITPINHNCMKLFYILLNGREMV